MVAEMLHDQEKHFDQNKMMSCHASVNVLFSKIEAVSKMKFITHELNFAVFMYLVWPLAFLLIRCIKSLLFIVYAAAESMNFEQIIRAS